MIGTDMNKARASRDDVNPGRVKHMDSVRATQRRQRWLALKEALSRVAAGQARIDARAELRAIEAEMRDEGVEP